MRRTTLAVSLALAGLALAMLVWWGVVGSARVDPLPPPDPDEGQEAELQLAYLEALVARRPEHWQARVNLAGALSRRDRDGEATVQLRQALRMRRADAQILRVLAHTAARAGFLDEEILAWNQLARRNPRDLQPRIRLATLYRQLGWFGLALIAVNDALRIAPADPDALRVHAVVDFASQDYVTAVAMARRLLRVDPRSAVGHSILSQCYREMGLWSRAAKEAEAAVRTDPHTIEFHTDLARLYMDRSDGPLYDRALAVLNEALPQSNRDEMARRYWRGVCFLRMRRLDAALADLGSVARQDPQFEEVAYHLGQAYQQLGDAGRAQTYMRAYQDRLDRQLALRDAEAAVRRNMNSPALHLRAARAALAVGNAAQAVTECQIALRLKPGDATGARLLKQSLERMGRSDEAGK